VTRWIIALIYWLLIGMAPVYAGCAALGPSIDSATEAARAVCRVIAKDWAPEIVAMMARLVTIAEGDCACPPSADPR